MGVPSLLARQNYIGKSGFAAAEHEHDEFNAQACVSASEVIRQPHCPNAVSPPRSFAAQNRRNFPFRDRVYLSFLINMLAARSLQLTIPPSLSALADEVIDEHFADFAVLANVRFALPAQPVDATQALNLSAGVSNAKVLRGRPSPASHNAYDVRPRSRCNAASQDESRNGAPWNKWTMTAYQIRLVQ